jgi:ribosomal protein L37AE/L43A
VTQINEVAIKRAYIIPMVGSAHPTCPNCGTSMRLARTIEQPDEHLQNVWECKACRLIATVSADENAPLFMG